MNTPGGCSLGLVPVCPDRGKCQEGAAFLILTAHYL